MLYNTIIPIIMIVIIKFQYCYYYMLSSHGNAPFPPEGAFPLLPLPNH